MRPLRLSMQAFGPYAGVVELDFRELEGRSLFLIHGPTGSGKTTILDAMCFALFGEAAGSDRKGKDARSHFADPSMATEVTLEFALGQANWRVRRVAEQARPGGVTMKPPQATLESLGEGGAAELRASKVRDVDAEVAALLGFEVEQFRQVVLLPQGEFRRLLVSDSRDREKILETLFEAELYRRIEGELKRAGVALEREVADGRTRVDELLRVSGAADVGELKRRGDEQEARKTELDALAETLRAHMTTAARDLTAAENAAAAFAESRAAAHALASLERDSPEQAARREELAAARRAQALEALTERLANASAALDGRRRTQQQAARTLSEAEMELAAATEALATEDARGIERDEAVALVRRLEQADAAARRLVELRAAIVAAETRIADATGAISLNDRDISYAEGRIAAADNELAPIRPLVAELERRKLRVADARRTLTAAGQLEGARSFLLRQSVETGGARQRVAEAEARVAGCQALESDLLRRWAEGQAAALARGLVDGRPCPVCGSTEHPAPAVATHDVASQADVDDARAAIADARAALDARRRELETETAREGEQHRSVAILESSLGDQNDISVQQAAAAFARAESDLVEAGRAHARVFELEAEKAQQRAAIEVATADRAAAQARRTDDELLLARDRAVAAEVAKDVPAEFAAAEPAARLEGARQRARQLSKACDEARARSAAARAAHAAAIVSAQRADVERVEAETAVSDASAGLDEALAAAGFATREQLASARRSAAEIDTLEGALKRFDEALAAARSRAERAAAAVEGLTMPDVDAARAAVDAARAAVDAALDENGRLQEGLSTTRRTLAAVGDLATRIENAERRFRAVGHVAAVASGDNASGVSFARFVLGTLLDDVLAAATERLLRMSQGRFALVRAGDRRDRRRSGGLDLEVFDAHTGAERPVATLSGGESFLASLSLALGLADVVQAHTGGIRLETIFVDEGFGTLDPEALDLAMRALEDLQAGGRLVGIISHVPELRERVGARLEVLAGRRGSTARFVSAGGAAAPRREVAGE